MDWENEIENFVKVFPTEYKKALEKLKEENELIEHP